MNHHTPRPASRITVALLSGTLALGTLPAPATFAAETDTEAEGTAPPAALPVSPEDDPDFDPGGDETSLEPRPDDEADQPIEDDPQLPPAVEQGPIIDPATVPGSVPVPTQGPEPPETALPSEPEATPRQHEPDPTTATEPAMPAVTAPGRGAVGEAAQARLIPTKKKPVEPTENTNDNEPATAPTGIVAAPDPGRRSVALALSSFTGSDHAPTRSNGVRFYRVAPGDSLWLIAKSLLPGAATDAQIARKVETLWRLNRQRIGTGSPDLLPVGIMLTLD